MEKSHVTMEEHICPICGNKHDTGAILLDKHMRKRFDRKTATGYGICKDCQEKLDAGFIALVEVRNASGRSTLKQEEAYRTGRMVWMQKSVALQIFNMPESAYDRGMMFIDKEVMDKLIEMEKSAKG